MLACGSPEQTHQRSSIVPNRLIEIKSFLERDLRIFAEMTLLKRCAEVMEQGRDELCVVLTLA